MIASQIVKDFCNFEEKEYVLKKLRRVPGYEEWFGSRQFSAYFSFLPTFMARWRGFSNENGIAVEVLNRTNNRSSVKVSGL